MVSRSGLSLSDFWLSDLMAAVTRHLEGQVVATISGVD
jgi:hypothetical protein